MKGMNS